MTCIVKCRNARLIVSNDAALGEVWGVRVKTGQIESKLAR